MFQNKNYGSYEFGITMLILLLTDTAELTVTDNGNADCANMHTEVAA